VRPATAVLDRLGTRRKLLLKELAAFGVVGGLSFVLDVGVFQLLYSNGVGAVTAKATSTVLAMTAAYLGNRYWSFSHRSTSSVRREFAIFVVINGFTGLLNLAIVAFVRYALHEDSAVILQAANVFGIGAGTVIRYGSYRKWVFAAEPKAPATPAAELPVGHRARLGATRASDAA
jgi:putative flippase GtrA